MSNNGKRVAWVTGGGTGIGESAAEHLAADGWIVVVTGRRQAELDRVVASITEKGGKAEAISLDVSNRADVDKAAAQESVLKDQSRAQLTEGQQLSQYQALELLMLPSANNVARLLARWDAGSEEAFIAKVNAEAAKLGMTNTTNAAPAANPAGGPWDVCASQSFSAMPVEDLTPPTSYSSVPDIEASFLPEMFFTSTPASV